MNWKLWRARRLQKQAIRKVHKAELAIEAAKAAFRAIGQEPDAMPLLKETLHRESGRNAHGYPNASASHG